jgi:hypothetical protein
MKKSKWDLPAAIILATQTPLWFIIYLNGNIIIHLIIAIITALLTIFYSYKSTRN